ncbi:MAG: antitoxin [Promicromonosporaceae bacterium]|nr:antitoxin [Promicromonosporaceae bacterium]
MTRTTLDLADRVIATARARAAQNGTSIGKEVSAMALAGLEPKEINYETGFPVLSPSDPYRVLTDRLISEHRDLD